MIQQNVKCIGSYAGRTESSVSTAGGGAVKPLNAYSVIAVTQCLGSLCHTPL